MSRSGILKHAIVGLMVTACLASAGDRNPNVVIFFTDDQGTLDANCYGSEDLYTPAMDRLAETGVRFTQAYAHMVCCPARAMLMTGRYPQRANVNWWTQGNAKTEKNRNMFRSEVTIAEALKGAGYATALFGKWHLGAHAEHGPTEQGFDEFTGLLGGFIDNYNHYFLHNDGFHDLYEGKEELFAEGEYFPDLITGRALDFVDRNKDVPFCMVVSFNTPHYPEQSDPKFDERYASTPMPRQSYAKTISTTDDRMKQILDRLDRHGLRDDTIIVFMSDNGHSAEDFAIKGADHKSGLPEGLNYGANGGGGNTGKWIGHKLNYFEGGIRVPAIVSYPSGLPQGIVRGQAITAMDWMPTILELCSVPLPDVKMDGHSLLPVIASESEPSCYKQIHWQWKQDWAVREGEWKLIVKEDGTRFLGNLVEEEPERKNHAEERPEVVERLSGLHERWLAEVTPEPQPAAEAGLCNAFEEEFLIGTIWHGDVLGNGKRNLQRAEEMAVTQKEFNAITAENCMKPSFIQPEEGVFTFAEADEFVHRASRMGHTIVGHTLVWKNDAPAWFFKDVNGNQVNRERLIERMTNHVKTIVSRYKGKIAFWDVVNEAVDILPNEDGQYEACLKPSPWLNIIGPDYIEIAYRAAHEADPEARLLYNDYNMYDRRKVDFIIEMVNDLRERGVPVHGIGVQGHMFLDFPDLGELEYVFKACTEAGIPMSVTEMDVSVLPNAWQHRGASVEDNFELAAEFNPYPDGVPLEVLRQQAERYREMFKLVLKYRDTVERVSLWGVWDGNSWRNYKPMADRTDYPLLFGRDFEKKLAYHELRKLASAGSPLDQE